MNGSSHGNGNGNGNGNGHAVEHRRTLSTLDKLKEALESYDQARSDASVSEYGVEEEGEEVDWKSRHHALMVEFKEFQDSTHQLEVELEHALDTAQQEIETLKARLEREASAHERTRRASTTDSAQSVALQGAVRELADKLEKMSETNRALEQEKDNVERKLRVLEHEREDALHKYEQSLEQNVLLQDEMRELKKQHQADMAQLHQQLLESHEALKQGKRERSPVALSRALSAASSSPSTPVAPAARSAIQDGLSSYKRGFFIVHKPWFDQWKQYVLTGKDRPQEISNWELMHPSGEPKAGLELGVHYIGVKESVWRALVKVYDGGPLIYRPTQDVYKKVLEEQ